MKFHYSLFLVCLAALNLTSCAKQISSDHYTAGHVGEASFTYPGVIRSMRQVRIEQSDQLEDNSTGIAGGSVAGGVLGNAIGRGNLLPTAAGALAGALTGSFVERKLKSQNGLEYIVELEDRQLMTVVQGISDPLAIGQPVYVVIGSAGRSRVTPRY